MEYPLAQMGGVEVLVRALVEGLGGDFEVVLVSDDDALTLGKEGWERRITRHIPWKYGGSDASAAIVLADSLKEAGVHLAHFHFGGTYDWQSKYLMCSPVVFTARQGIPCLLTNHLVTTLTEGYCHPDRPLGFRLLRLPIAWASRLHVLACAREEFTVSRRDCRAERRLFFPLRKRISQVYHSILDEAECPPARERTRTVITVGTIGPRKGQHILLEAFARIAPDFPGWQLRILGRDAGGEYSQRVLRAATHPNLLGRVEMAGRVSDGDIQRAMSESAVFAMPSFAEGLGLSLQEAMFRGCVCVGSQVGGIPDLIEHEKTGLLVPPGDAGALAEGLARLLSNPELRRRFSENGRASIPAKGMTRRRMIERHGEIYRRTLRTGG